MGRTSDEELGAGLSNDKPVQERNDCCDCHNDEFGNAHATDQDQRKRNSQYGEDKPLPVGGTFSAGELLPQHGKSGTSHSVNEKVGGGGKRGVPAESPHKCERPDQNGKGNNRDVWCLAATVHGGKTAGESRLVRR
jgi:hypothetical protein